MKVTESKYYRAQSITGPRAVLVSIKFGNSEQGRPLVTKKSSINCEELDIDFDLENHISEVLTGVSQANKDFGGYLQVIEIEVIPSDYPGLGQAKAIAYNIAKHVITKGT